MPLDFSLDEKIADVELTLFGQKESVALPVLRSKDYVIRPMRESDFAQISAYNDPSLSEQLSVESLKSLTGIGYSFEPGRKGIVAYVADFNGEVVGRAYVKTWHASDFTKPKFRQTNTGGIEVITAAELVDNANTLVELGGWLVKPGHRSKGIAQALTYATTGFIAQMQREGYGAGAVFITNVGPLKAQDNPQGIDYAGLLTKAISEKRREPIRDIVDLAGYGELLSGEEFTDVFNGLEIEQKVSGQLVKVPYQFGMPREATAPAYVISDKLAHNGILANVRDSEGVMQGMVSPLEFLPSKTMHPEHGGNYTVAHL